MNTQAKAPHADTATAVTATQPSGAPEGWVRYDLSCRDGDLDVSVEPDADLDGTFAAYCHDDGSMLIVHGWNVTLTEPVEQITAA